jgi:uncharacterized RDD family membrane protein YckC
MSILPNQANLPEATLGKRFLAICIDWAIAWSISTLLTPNVIPETSISTLVVFYFEVLILTYFMQSSMGQFLVGIKIVDKETHGRIGFKRTLIRTTLIILVLPAIFTKDLEPYHNVLTYSRVVSIK